jgi:hypothetical protein
LRHSGPRLAHGRIAGHRFGKAVFLFNGAQPPKGGLFEPGLGHYFAAGWLEA